MIAKNIGMEFIGDNSLSKLKLSSKRLKSGRVQVKFQMRGGESGQQYGYLLTEPKASLKDVVVRILNSYQFGLSMGGQSHLYSVGRQRQTTEMLFFK